MLWLKAMMNCTKRGTKALVVSILIAIGILIAGFVVIVALGLLFNGIVLLIGPETCAAIDTWLDGHVFWILGGLVAVMLGILGWDAISTEKKKLERRASDAGDNG